LTLFPQGFALFREGFGALDEIRGRVQGAPAGNTIRSALFTFDMDFDTAVQPVWHLCGNKASTVHSWTQRSVRDLNLASTQVWLRCEYRKLFWPIAKESALRIWSFFIRTYYLPMTTMPQSPVSPFFRQQISGFSWNPGPASNCGTDMLRSCCVLSRSIAAATSMPMLVGKVP
jgi:hypothetical protein